MVYYAKIIEENGCFMVLFPQFAHINTYGESQEAALANAEEALNGCIESDFDRGFNIPQPEKYEGEEFHEIPLRPHIEIAVALRFIRSNRSQMELARELGISYQAYQRLENPRRCNPTVKTLERIASVLDKRVEIAIT